MFHIQFQKSMISDLLVIKFKFGITKLQDFRVLFFEE